MSIERRRSPRIEILGRLHGHIASLDVPVKVREISLGGLSMETSFAFPSGVIHEFQLTMGDDSSVLMRGRIMHSREATGTDGSRLFVTGVQFVDDNVAADGETTIGDLIQKVR